MFPAVAALALALAPPPAVQLARLAELYRAYELPLPPKDAKLYRWNRTGWAGHSGFGVRPNADGWPDELLVGCWERSAYFKETVEIQLDPTTIKPGELSLLTVVQLQMIGRHELAETVYAAGGYWKVSSPAEALAARAFDYWEGQLLNPAVDRAKIARRIALVLNGQTKAFGQERYKLASSDSRPPGVLRRPRVVAQADRGEAGERGGGHRRDARREPPGWVDGVRRPALLRRRRPRVRRRARPPRPPDGRPPHTVPDGRGWRVRQSPALPDQAPRQRHPGGANGRRLPAGRRARGEER